MSSRARTSIVGNPLLLGTVAILVILSGIYVSYTATKGLPFVPKYRVEVEVPKEEAERRRRRPGAPPPQPAAA